MQNACMFLIISIFLTISYKQVLKKSRKTRNIYFNTISALPILCSISNSWHCSLSTFQFFLYYFIYKCWQTDAFVLFTNYEMYKTRILYTFECSNQMYIIQDIVHKPFQPCQLDEHGLSTQCLTKYKMELILSN